MLNLRLSIFCKFTVLLLLLLLVVLAELAFVLIIKSLCAFSSSALMLIGVALRVLYQRLRAKLIAFRELQECGEYINRQGGDYRHVFDG